MKCSFIFSIFTTIVIQLWSQALYAQDRPTSEIIQENTQLGQLIVDGLYGAGAGVVINSNGVKEYRLSLAIQNQLWVVLAAVSGSKKIILCNLIKKRVGKTEPYYAYLDDNCDGGGALKVYVADQEVLSFNQMDENQSNKWLKEFTSLISTLDGHLRYLPVDELQVLPDLKVWRETRNRIVDILDMQKTDSRGYRVFSITSSNLLLGAEFDGKWYTNCTIKVFDMYHTDSDCDGLFEFQGENSAHQLRRRDNGKGVAARINRVLGDMVPFARFYHNHALPAFTK